ncbi:ABC-three component system protein [Flavobacterium fluviale]|uniref:ABC-three component systems C-terminal domain-containing protein n=1 Tax=Flavobacterium fluviale TaxID=2249356 RepID=A0A344LXK6_9FLAO|nr:ABC-three component system protein [Flavobacterium fluviale]AXB58648.1 hypothetical protein HYN86_19490 [Flavobacterium fluviale]
MIKYTSSSRIIYGQHIIPIKRIESFYPDEWEEFIEEWLDLKKSVYHSIEKFGGAGDMGRDVVAYIDNPVGNLDYRWDCYQCKHYKAPITPSNVYCEFAKIIYYSFIKEYPVPQKYYFVAPQDCGTKLSKLLINPEKLKSEIKENWEKHCANQITNKTILLEEKLLEYFEKFDFSIFGKVQRKDVLKEHVNHSNHLARFGGSLPDRPKVTEKDIPINVQSHELVYVNNLLNAYNSTGKCKFIKTSDIDKSYLIHFKKAREGFHFAEQLRVLYRDSLPINTYEDFQEEIFSGIANTLLTNHVDSYEKVKMSEDKAQQIQITSNPLKDVSKPQDRIGICHQLSNMGKINWENE